MKYEHATLVVTNAAANGLRQLAFRLDKGDMANMFTTGLSASGNLPATHWISSGYVPKPLIVCMNNPVTMFNVAKATWEADGEVFPFSQAQVTNTLGNCTVSNGTTAIDVGGVPTVVPEGPHALIARLGLKLIQSAA